MFANSLFIDIKYLSIWSDFLYVDERIDSNFITQNVPFIMKKLPLIMILLGCLIIFFLYFSLKKIIPLIKRHLSFLYNFFKHKWYVDQLYERIIIKPTFYLGKGFWKSVDQELIDNLGPNGFSRVVLSLSFLISKLQSGYLYHYVLSIVIGLTFLISLYTYIF